jgi:hypothetical protein
MTYITATSTANPAPIISRRGTDNVFAELIFDRTPSGMIELVCTLVEYNEFTGRYTRDELGRAIVDAEEAADAALDLEWIAVEALDETGNLGTIERLGFGEAVEAELACTFAMAAE